ncbi:MAG: hypothetical protein AAGD25_41115 [Cyanobacteria bacterium P01_F01_bin.150]
MGSWGVGRAIAFRASLGAWRLATGHASRSHFLQSNSYPNINLRPAFISTYGRVVHGGS